MLEQSLVEKVIDFGLKKGAEFVEIFVEDKFETKMTMIEGRVEAASSERIYGLGLRLFGEDQQVYAYTNDFSEDNLLKMVVRLVDALNLKPKNNVTLNMSKSEIQNRHVIFFYPNEVSKSEKVRIMKLAHEGAKGFSNLITQVVVRYWDYDQKIFIANSDGLMVEDRRIKTRLMVSAVAFKDGEQESGFYGPGASMGIEFFNFVNPFDIGVEAARIADRMVRAEHAPAGRMPVVIANEFGGVIFHEACGHALEATSVAKGASVFAGKLGQKVAAECVSAVDDGTIPNAWGSSNVDDEGIPTQRNVLIENGILKNYLVDRFHAKKMGLKPNGCARRQDYRFAPTSRMSNTFILPGKYLPEEIIAATDCGLYAKRMGGGSVHPATGEFNFAVMEGYLIEKGRITKPVRGATLIGKGIDVINKIDMVANDLARGQGMCGSISGSVPADVGQPTIRVSELIVGGRSK
ncbi:TldD/PmbA family protein [Pseudothermotoga thermarum]|uniref:Microcin-processing peptidase 2 n=1 Tax=Pseudothermotoga thermarum DSM 5069 TaxID=688269 RepID=F7YYC7_9THEM|nr:TldD/PmbA family protein [Pseudothermotoga thermarum]AEH50948.1 microcin-processing peptidase 2 [Pseudothermotoga thermarum DSM 5069]